MPWTAAFSPADRGTAWFGEFLLGVLAAAVAAWTLVYDVCLAFGQPADVAMAAWVLSLPACAWFAVRHAAEAAEADSQERSAPPGSSVLVIASAASGVLGAVLIGSTTSAWPIAWLLGALAAVGGLAVAHTRSPHVEPHVKGAPAESQGSALALVAAVLLALFSLFVLRPDADDVFYVNKSTWVAEHGSFPWRDTIFSDQVFSAVESPPVSSFEALAGSLARVFHVAGADVVYLVVPPLGTLAATLALWQLLRAWRSRRPLVALVVALLFLLEGGAVHASFGNLFLARMWQGKVLFVALWVPLVLASAVRWLTRQQWFELATLALLGVGGVGLTSTATLILPLFAAVLLAAALSLREPRAGLLGALALSSYPVAAAAFIHFSGGPSANAAALGDPAATYTKVYGLGVMAGLGLLAVVLAWLPVEAPAGRRLMAICGFLVWAVILAPGVLDLAGHATGAAPILWRLLWVAPAAPLLGALSTRARWPGESARWPVSAVALAAILLAVGEPIWSPANHASVGTVGWKFEPAALEDARLVVRVARQGDVALAPEPVSAALAVVTTRIHAVDPRQDYVMGLAQQPGFDAGARQLLARFAAGQPADAAAVRGALSQLDVRVACLPPADAAGGQLLNGAGYHPALATATLSCFVLRN